MCFIQVRFIQIVTAHGQNGKKFSYEKIFSIFITCCLLASLCKTAYAFETENAAMAVKDGRLVAQSAIQKLVDDYFSVRKDSILQADKDSLAGNLTTVTSSNDVFKKEMSRSSVRDDLARLHGVYVSTVDNSAFITSVESLSKDGSHIMLDVYEWNWITYTDGKGGSLDEMGYVTEHQIEIARNKAGGYMIVGDTYDESDILGGGVSEKVSAADDRSAADASRSANGVNSSVNYNVNAVIDYADNWVIHGYAPNSGANSSYYNLKAYGYYIYDCANFVSQCMRAGGMQWDYGNGKDNGNWDGTQWWFDTNPDSNYNNYDVSPNSWRKVDKFVLYRDMPPK